MTANSVPGISNTVPQEPSPMIGKRGGVENAFAFARFIRSTKLDDVDTIDPTVRVLRKISCGESSQGIWEAVKNVSSLLGVIANTGLGEG